MITYDDAIENKFVYKDKFFIFDTPQKKGLRFWMRHILCLGAGVLYRIILSFTSRKKMNYKYSISICAIFKNEAKFLNEWLEFHILVGIEHFYLYNNNSEDNYLAILTPYIQDGIVTLVNWPDNPGQISAYNNWYHTFRDETKWISFIDCDEFICPLYNNSLKTWIKRFEKYPLVMVYWKMFGTSGLTDHDDARLVTEQYTVSWPKLTNIGKLFYQTKYDIAAFKSDMMHCFSVRYSGINIPPVNSFGYFVKYGIHRTGGKEPDIQINHYWSKAYNAYIKKHERGDAAFGVSPRDFDYFIWHETRNIFSDYSAYRYIIQLKQKMRRE